jgi:glycosyltransferase involved in cell wall biosynthesis
MKEKVAETTLRQKIGENAYEYTKENLSWTVYARNMEIIFQKAINSFQTVS